MRTTWLLAMRIAIKSKESPGVVAHQFARSLDTQRSHQRNQPLVIGLTTFDVGRIPGVVSHPID